MLLALATAATLCAHAEAGEEVKVFLMAGQSNMAGQADADGLTGTLAGYKRAQPGVNIWRSYQDENDTAGSTNGWVPLAPELGNFYHLRNDPDPRLRGFEPSFGPEVSFGKAVSTALPDEDIYIIKHAWGATSLASGWDPVAGIKSGVMTGNNGTPGLQYNLFTGTVSAALKSLDDAGTQYEVAGMLWLQGESDAIHAASDKAYEANLTAFIAKVRENYGNDLPFIIARINPEWGGAESKTRAAQQSVAEATEGVYWFDTDAFSRPAGNVHYDTPGQIELGRAFADVYLDQVARGSSAGVGGRGRQPDRAQMFGVRAPQDE